MILAGTPSDVAAGKAGNGCQDSSVVEGAVNEAGLLEMALDPEHGEAVDGAPEVAGYQIISRLGVGSSGEVWLAEELEPGRTVALKILHRYGSADASVEVLQRECRIIAQLIHTNLVLLYRGVVTADGRQGLAMEWIDGWPLDEWLQQHPDLSLTQKLELFRGMVRGVAYLHDHGVIHRDLKPANVIVDMHGVAKIVDFGLARLHQEEAASGMDGGSIGVSGTLHFMAPEQAANGKGARSMPVDVYALGLMLHRILAGKWLRPPDATAAEMLAQVLQPPALVLHGPARQLPRDLQSILHQALSPDPARRYHHARDLEADLNRFAAKQPVAARKHTLFYLTTTFLRRQARRSALAGGLVLAGLVVGGAIYHRHRVVAERNEANLRYAYTLTSSTLRQLRDDLRTATPEDANEPLAVPGSGDGTIPTLPVNAAGELDLRYYQALLADLRAATSEGQARYGPALKSIQPALDLYSKLAHESPGDPKRLLDAAQARLTFARLQGRVGSTDDAGHQARKALQQVDRLAVWPGFDAAPLAPMRCDALRLLAKQALHAGDSAGAFELGQEALAACERLPSGLLVRPENEFMPRLALAASDLATYAIAAGPSSLPEARLKISQATAACRAAYEREPKSAPLAYGLAHCLHATARLSLHDGSGADLQPLFEEAAKLLIDTPSGTARSSFPVVWEISGSVTDWAGSLLDHPDFAVPNSALNLAQKFTVQLLRRGQGRDEVQIQKARIYFYQSRLVCRFKGRGAAARPISFAVALLRPRQLRDPEHLPLALLTAAALHHARGLADLPGTKWDEDCARHLESLLKELTDKADGLTPEQQHELAALK
ncbi:MAG: serine/threonine-protein kinase [Verrucomicrobiota bacterium]